MLGWKLPFFSKHIYMVANLFFSSSSSPISSSSPLADESLQSEDRSRHSLIFAINGNMQQIENPDPEITLLSYLRSTGIMTKLGCGEASCGTCTVVLQSQNNEKIMYKSANSCITPICAVDGINVITVEGVGTSATMHPVQTAMASSFQCGYCSPGFVMSMYALLQQKEDLPPSRLEIERCLDGNLCRCTGYRSILDALQPFSKHIVQCSSSAMIPFPKQLQLASAAAPLAFFGPRTSWYRPTNLNDFLYLKSQYPSARIVVGNSELEIERKFRGVVYSTLISPVQVKELCEIEETKDGIVIGSAVRLTQLEMALKELVSKHQEGKTRFFVAVLKQLRWFASTQTRNNAAVGGNIVTASPISDLNPLWMAFDCRFTIISATTRQSRVVGARNFFLGYRKVDLNPDEILVSVFLQFSDESKGEYAGAYKQSRRREDDIAIVNAGTYLRINDAGKVEDAYFAFGGMAPKTVNAPRAAAFIVGKKLDDERAIIETLDQLVEDLPLAPDAPGGMVEYRRALASSFLFKFLTLDYMNKMPEGASDNDEDGEPSRPPESSTSSILGTNIPHLSADLHVTGEALFTDDIPSSARTLYSALVLSSIPYGRIISVDASAALAMPGVKAYIGASDVPNNSNFGPVVEDEQVFASEYVYHVGQIVGVICAESSIAAKRAATQVKVRYEPLPAILSIQEAIAAQSYLSSAPSKIFKGDSKAAMQSAPNVVEGEVCIGGQEHFYMETQTSLCIPQEAEEMTIWTSSQNPTKTQSTVAHVLDVPKTKISVKVKRLGGGFGGKESRSVFLSTALAVAAKKLGVPVRMMLDRDVDMRISGQRHPFYCKYKVGFNDQGELLAVELQLYSNGGAFMDLSRPVMDRALFHCDGAYHCENFSATGQACKTNLPPNTAFRGFGAPQATMIAETYLDHVARFLKLPTEAVRKRNLYLEGHSTHFRQELTDCPLQSMWDSLATSSDFENRRLEIEHFNSRNRWKKRGIAMTPAKYGMSFIAKFMNSASALVHVYTDGSVVVSHGGTEMGQGLHTKMAMVAADAFGIPLSGVHVRETSTDTCANTHPSAASCSADLNGMAILDACSQIKDRMNVVFQENPAMSFAEAVMECFMRRIDLSAHGFYRTPDIGFDWDTQSGRPFHYFTFGIACSEVEIDCLTGDHILRRVDILQDAGNSLNPAMDVGQIQGAFIQGYGLYCLEELVWSSTGNLLTRGPSTYKIPSINDIPAVFRTDLYKSPKGTQKRTLFSSKGVGEPGLLLGTSVVAALKHAISAARSENGLTGPFRMDCPVTCERIRMNCNDFITNKFY